MNRQLSSTISKEDHALALAEELVHFGFINEVYHNCFIIRKTSLLFYLCI